MLAAIAQVFNFLPYGVDDLYCDNMDGLGVEWWYNAAVKISKENEKAVKRK